MRRYYCQKVAENVRQIMTAFLQKNGRAKFKKDVGF